MKKSSFIIVSLTIGILLVAGALVWWFGFKSDTNSQSNISPTLPQPTIDEKLIVADFTIEARNDEFSPRSFTVEPGKKYKIRFRVLEGNHDFVVDDWAVQTPLMQAGQERLIDMLVPQNTSGQTLEFFCTQHKALGMVGQIFIK